MFAAVVAAKSGSPECTPEPWPCTGLQHFLSMRMAQGQLVRRSKPSTVSILDPESDPGISGGVFQRPPRFLKDLPKKALRLRRRAFLRRIRTKPLLKKALRLRRRAFEKLFQKDFQRLPRHFWVTCASISTLQADGRPCLQPSDSGRSSFHLF